MTNTKFRKRALLSSVAMLLVALVALGSATFAWFTSLPTANAQGLQMKATAAQGLVVISSSALKTTAQGGPNKSKDVAADWTHDEFLNCNADRNASKTDSVSIDAASCAQDANASFFTTNASADTAADAKADAEVTTATGMYHEELWCKITGSNTDANIKMTGLTITPNGTHALLPAFRVALYYTNAAGTKTFVGEYAVEAHNNETHITGLGTPGENGKTYYNVTNVATPNVNCVRENKNVQQAASVSNAALGSCNGAGNCKLDIYCYLDGEDSTCFTNNVNAVDVISKIKVDLAIA